MNTPLPFRCLCPVGTPGHPHLACPVVARQYTPALWGEGGIALLTYAQPGVWPASYVTLPIPVLGDGTLVLGALTGWNPIPIVALECLATWIASIPQEEQTP